MWMFVTGSFKLRGLHMLDIETIWGLCNPKINSSEASVVRQNITFTTSSQTARKRLGCFIRSRFADICDNYLTLKEINTIMAIQLQLHFIVLPHFSIHQDYLQEDIIIKSK
jgi:hypothetical protein